MLHRSKLGVNMDFKFFDEVVQQLESQRKAAEQAWEKYMEEELAA